MITIEQLKDVQQRADKLKAYLQIDEKRIQLEEEELHTQAPGFWDDAKAAEAQKGLANGKTTFKAYLWKVCGDAYDDQHNG